MKLAILGFAHAHVSMYAEEIEPMAEAEVAWGWDHDVARGEERCRTFGCEFVPELAEVLARPDLAGVIIGAETSRHGDVCEAAARAGKAILLQKPMALTLEECDRIIAAVDAAGVRFSLAWQMRCDPQNQWVREATQSGRIGKVMLVRRRHGLNTHMWAGFEESWHVQPALNRGMWMDDASHPADLLAWMLGRPRSVMAEIDTLLNPKIPDDTGVAIYRFAEGVMGILECSFACPAAAETTLIVGDRGVIVQDYGDAISCGPFALPEGTRGLRYLMAGDREWTYVDIPTPPTHGYRIRAVAREAVAFFQGKRDPIATAEEGRLNVEMLLAAHQSAAEGRRVAL